ncbi:MerR family transcriptional regulator [uncultured Ruegeria sp.]|uniref:MerR family transcriptional regulator n=1 Tax=uncultured Ruegeria sp. TaxID=259304 RepID=UPI002612CC84|nr:MerR family transcriptional regulator [uncultured Ruegeria sp.]
MSKSPDAFRTISEVADWLGVQAHVLRFWESRFTQVKPVKRAGGRRYYRPNDMRLLGGIKRLLHEEGITIKGVQRILREQGVAHVASLSPSLDDMPETSDAVVVPFSSEQNAAPAAEQIHMDLENTNETTAVSEARKPAARGYLDEAPLLGGIATQAWSKTEFDDQLLRQIAPVAKELRTLLNRIENRAAG